MRRHRITGLVCMTAILPACAGDGTTSPEISRDEVAPSASHGSRVALARAVLRNAAGQEIGVAFFADGGAGLLVNVAVSSTSPGRHGIHLHAIGVCNGATTPPFSSAGGHFNPTARQHGFLNPAGPHGGDLPNIDVLPNGFGVLVFNTPGATLQPGPLSLLDADGAAIVLHQNEDDQVTDSDPVLGPGRSGPRIACGVIERI